MKPCLGWDLLAQRPLVQTHQTGTELIITRLQDIELSSEQIPETLAPNGPIPSSRPSSSCPPPAQPVAYGPIHTHLFPTRSARPFSLAITSFQPSFLPFVTKHATLALIVPFPPQLTLEQGRYSRARARFSPRGGTRRHEQPRPNNS